MTVLGSQQNQKLDRIIELLGQQEKCIKKIEGQVGILCEMFVGPVGVQTDFDEQMEYFVDRFHEHAAMLREIRSAVTEPDPLR